MAQAQQTATAPLARLREFVALYIRKMTSELETCVVLTEYYSMTPEHTEAIQRRRRVLDSELRALVQQAMDEGQIAPCDPKLAVFFFMGAINNINRWFTEDGPLAGEQIAQAFADHAIACLSRSAARAESREPSQVDARCACAGQDRPRRYRDHGTSICAPSRHTLVPAPVGMAAPTPPPGRSQKKKRA